MTCMNSLPQVSLLGAVSSCYSTQGSFANMLSSDAHEEIEIYGHSLLQSLTSLTKHTHTKEKLSTVSLLSARKKGHVWLSAALVTQGWAESNSGEKAARGNSGAFFSVSSSWTCRKSLPVAAGAWFHFSGDVQTGGNTSWARREGEFTRQSFNWIIFLLLRFLPFGKMPCFAPGHFSTARPWKFILKMYFVLQSFSVRQDQGNNSEMPFLPVVPNKQPQKCLSYLHREEHQVREFLRQLA